MNYETIKTELRKKGFSMSMIAEALGCSPVNVHQVCKGQNNSYRVAKAVAAVLELKVNDVFPTNYLDIQDFPTSREQRVEELKQRLAG
jgi:lambda repressor-like predicted transcriptional regulator